MTREDPIVIVSAVRTPMGGFLGDFKDVNAATLGAAAVRAAVERARLQADEAVSYTSLTLPTSSRVLISEDPVLFQ